MIKRFIITVAILFAPLFSQDLQFSADSAYQSIEQLSVTIGPRIMGSQQEQRTLKWVKGKYASFGADTAFILPFTVADRYGEKLITNSGTAVSVFKGKSDSIIVVGGHLDSAGPEYPGANDNASGTATVIELARLWSQRPHYYTMVFCSFGGEEVGLIGSQNFVKDFSQIDKVVLMISADMGGTDSKIGLMFETDSIVAPKWLVKDAFKVDSETNYNRLFYDTHFSTQNYLSSRGSGSDHMSFLNKGIPAIDFTSNVNDSPIHTQQDKIDFIDKDALGQYGNFIDHLLLRYQNGGLEHSKLSDESFMLWQLAGLNIYLPIWLITIFNLIAIVLGIFSFVIARKNRIIVDKSMRIRISGLKVFIIFIIILIFSQLGEAFIQMFKGYRYPWPVHLDTYIIYSVIWVFAGLWIGLQLTRKWKFSPDPYIYSKRALIVLFIFTVGSLIISTRLALYPGFMLMLVSIGMLVKKDWLSIVLILVSPILIFLLFFNEEFTFMSRMLINTGFQFDNIMKSFVANAVLIALLSGLFLPMLNAYAYLAFKYESIRKLLLLYRKPVVAI
ncbi:MAG: M28 family metallopeptidase, partial [Calditrichaceae bacterium]